MRLIDAEALKEGKFHINESWTSAEQVSWQWGWNDAIDAIINAAPTVDPVKHGHWDNKIIDGRFDVPHTVARCSNCRGRIWVYVENYVVKWSYCPLCGAKMDEVTGCNV